MSELIRFEYIYINEGEENEIPKPVVAHYSTMGICELFDLRPKEVQAFALRVGLIKWEPDRGLRPGPSRELQMKAASDFKRLAPKQMFPKIDLRMKLKMNTRRIVNITDLLWPPLSLDAFAQAAKEKNGK